MYVPKWITSSRNECDARVREQYAARKKTKQEKDNFGEWLDKNAYAGLASFNKGLASTIDFLIPDAIGFGLDKKLNEYYDKEYDRISSEANKSSETRGEGYKMAGDVISNTVSAMPNALLAVMSGGSSAAGGIIGTGGQSASAINTAGQMMKNPMFWTSFMRSAGNNYEEAKAKGASDGTAAISATLSTLLEAGVEVGGGIEKLPELIKTNKRLLNNWVRSAVKVRSCRICINYCWQ